MLETVFGIIKWIAVIGGILFGISKCQESEWYQASQRQSEADRRARQTPHVIREADGCKVYAFERDSKEHYFTRCGETVTTERTYTESCGKSCTKQKSEVIVTRDNK